MAQDPSGGNGTPSKWTIAKTALASVFQNYDGKLPIGLDLFGKGTTGCNVGGFEEAPAYGTGAAINMTLANNSPATSTPTCAAVNNLRGQAVMKDATRGQYILLITDGSPNCQGAAPCANANQVTDTTTQIAAALAQTPPIKTFVVGFGALTAAEQMAMDAFANAGGVPNNDPNFPGHTYYPADNQTVLLASLNKILTTITGGGDTGGTQVLCDDSCYSNPCPTGQVCVNAACKANPCASTTCAAGQYCYTDGNTATCVSSCAMSCPAGQRCDRGQCVADSCAVACGVNTVCDPSTGQCVNDPSCSGVLCKPSQGCFGGQCKDDPCTLVTCPSGTSCVPFDGSCVPPDYFDNPCNYIMCSGNSACDPVTRSCSSNGTVANGCSCDIGDSRSRSFGLMAPALFLLALMLRRRAFARR
jgi:hypothetical protein